jgi:hypothetical protein
MAWVRRIDVDLSGEIDVDLSGEIDVDLSGETDGGKLGGRG